jgi:hypothetical protein
MVQNLTVRLKPERRTNRSSYAMIAEVSSVPEPTGEYLGNEDAKRYIVVPSRNFH